MDLTNPAAAALPALRARVLMVLVRADAGLTGRRVATLADGSVAGVAKVLDTLVAGGLVHRIEAGSARLHTLNREHLAAPAVESLAGMRQELLARLRSAVATFSHRPLSAVLFGSAVRGDGHDASDVDVLLVRPPGVEEDDAVWAADVERLGSGVLAWTGNPLNVIHYSGEEIADCPPRRRALLGSIESEAVLVHGAPLATLRRRKSAAPAR